MTGLEQLKVWIMKYQKVNGNPPIEEIKMQIDLLDAEEREQCNIYLVIKWKAIEDITDEEWVKVEKDNRLVKFEDGTVCKYNDDWGFTRVSYASV